MDDRLRVQSANLLTGLRVVLTPAFVVAVWGGPQNRALGLAAAGLFVVIAASDVWDGRLARHYGNESNAGRVFDHLADIGFILSALSTYVLESLVPWWVPAAIGASFAFYVLDSWAHSGAGVRRLIGSRVGHLAGICNYSLVGILVFNHTAGIHLLPAEMLRWLFWLVPFYSAVAVISRAMVCAPWHQSASELSIVQARGRRRL
jgi:phosphatidylglycerophosphate synthase